MKHLFTSLVLVGIFTTNSVSVMGNQLIRTDVVSQREDEIIEAIEDEATATTIEAGAYIYEESPSPYFAGEVLVKDAGAGSYMLSANRLFNSGGTAPFRVTLKQVATEPNLFTGNTKLLYTTTHCSSYANRGVEVRAFKNSVSDPTRFVVRETGQNGLRCKYFGPRPPSCACRWVTDTYDFTHPKAYVRK